MVALKKVVALVATSPPTHPKSTVQREVGQAGISVFVHPDHGNYSGWVEVNSKTKKAFIDLEVVESPEAVGDAVRGVMEGLKGNSELLQVFRDFMAGSLLPLSVPVEGWPDTADKQMWIEKLNPIIEKIDIFQRWLSLLQVSEGASNVLEITHAIDRLKQFCQEIMEVITVFKQSRSIVEVRKLFVKLQQLLYKSHNDNLKSMKLLVAAFESEDVIAVFQITPLKKGASTAVEHKKLIKMIHGLGHCARVCSDSIKPELQIVLQHLTRFEEFIPKGDALDFPELRERNKYFVTVLENVKIVEENLAGEAMTSTGGWAAQLNAHLPKIKKLLSNFIQQIEVPPASIYMAQLEEQFRVLYFLVFDIYADLKAGVDTDRIFKRPGFGMQIPSIFDIFAGSKARVGTGRIVKRSGFGTRMPSINLDRLRLRATDQTGKFQKFLSSVPKLDTKDERLGLQVRKDLSGELKVACQKWAELLGEALSGVREKMLGNDECAAVHIISMLAVDSSKLDFGSLKSESPVLQFIAQDPRFKSFAESCVSFYDDAIEVKLVALQEIERHRLRGRGTRFDGNYSQRLKIARMYERVLMEHMKVKVLF